MVVYTTINSNFQNAASLSLRKGLEEYDKRHGYRQSENISTVFPQGFLQSSRSEQISLLNDFFNVDSDSLEKMNSGKYIFGKISISLQNNGKNGGNIDIAHATYKNNSEKFYLASDVILSSSSVRRISNIPQNDSVCL